MKVAPPPWCVVPGTRPAALHRTEIRRVEEAFDRTGGSVHSSHGATLWAVVKHAHETGRPIEIWTHPEFGGYYTCRAGQLPGLHDAFGYAAVEVPKP